MNDAVGKAPTFEQELAAFKGAATEEGVIKSMQAGTPVEGEEGEQGEQGAGGEAGDGSAPPVKAPAVPQKPKSAQERIDLAVRRQREAERKADAAEARAAAAEARAGGGQPQAPLTKQPEPVNSPDPNAPDPLKFQFGELDPKYISAVARYETRKTLDEERAQQVERSRVAERAELAKSYRTFVSKAEERYPDFRSLVAEGAERNEWSCSETLAMLALESEVGADILYELASSPDESRVIAAMAPAKQAKWFGAKEALLSAEGPAATRQSERREPTLPVRTTNAPPPPQTRLRAGGSPEPVKADTTDFAAFERLAQDRRAH